MNTNFKFVLIIIALSFIKLNAAPTIVDGLKSAVLPGWGEISNGSNVGYVFLTAEFTFWASMFYFEGESKLKIRQSEQFAINNANMANFNIDKKTWQLMEKYDRSGFEPGGYNAKVVNDAIVLYPDKPADQTKYIMENALSDDIYWDWEKSEIRKQYQIFRKDSMHFKDFALAASGAILANHIFSFINSIRVSNKKHKAIIYTTFDSELNPYIKFIIFN